LERQRTGTQPPSLLNHFWVISHLVMPCAGVLPFINVALCGAIPRSHLKMIKDGRSADDNSKTTPYRRETLMSPGGGKLLALPISKCTGSVDTTTHPPVTPRSRSWPLVGKENFLVNAENRHCHNSANVEVPSWATAASGEARLEPVCEAYGTHPPVNLTSQPFYVIGRSPASHVPLLHRTSSRLHAYFFHHPSGAAFVMDCRSAHGTYVNGQLIVPGLPIRVKRGGLVRFGGVGAPCFVLKSFSVEFDRMVNDLDGVADVLKHSNITKRKDTARLSFKNEIDCHGVACIKNGDGSGMACITDADDASSAALVLLNTRVNACGGIGTLSKSHQKLSNVATMKFTSKLNEDHNKIKKLASRNHKRRFDDFTDASTSVHKSILTLSNPVTSERRVRRKVSFDNEKPELFFPALVTPQDLSSDDESTSTEDSS